MLLKEKRPAWEGQVLGQAKEDVKVGRKGWERRGMEWIGDRKVRQDMDTRTME